MPRAPKRPCRQPGCPNLCDTSVYCEVHRSENAHDFIRGSAASRGYDAKWRAARKRYLQLHPLCVKCKERGKLTPATVVDHILPHRGDSKLFWDENNWQPLCKDCHDIKTGHGL